MDKKLTSKQRDEILEECNRVLDYKNEQPVIHIGEIVEILNENTCTEHVLDSILCCIHCGIERPAIEEETKQGEFLGYYPDGEPVGYADVEEEG